MLSGAGSVSLSGCFQKHVDTSGNLKWTAFAHLCVSESLTTVQHFQKILLH